MAKENCCKDSARLNKVGGQAVLEGVMMKAGENTVTTCRTPEGEIVVTEAKFVSVRKKHKFLNFPILRGVVNFVEMMKLSVQTMNASAEALGLEEEEEGKFERWLKKHLGIGITDFIVVLGTVLGVVLALLLFMVVPTALTALLDLLIPGDFGAFATAALEGIFKIAIFLLYLWLVAFIPDIKRTFMYHGAEHKSIACFEAGAELTPAEARKYTRFHPRCGTSFMFVMILLGMLAGFFIHLLLPGLHRAVYVLIRLAILPVVVGIGYEFIMFAGKHDNAVTRALSAPGLWVQRLTTKEPDEDMLEIALISLRCALRDEFDEFRAFYEARPWEKKPEEPNEAEGADAASGDIPPELSELDSI